MRIKLKIFFLAFVPVLIAVSRVFAKSPDLNRGMEYGDALSLAKAWAHSSGESVDIFKTKIESAGDFEFEIRGARLVYHSKNRQLQVSGLVGQDLLQFAASEAPWKKLQAAAMREEPTMGEGHFELVKTKIMNADPPILLLTKSFSNGAISEMQFLVEVRWLLEWATHWRKTRITELFSGSSQQEIERQGIAYVKWAREKRRRPW